MEPSDEIKQVIHDKVIKLDRFSKDIITFKVIVEAPHKHHHKGNLYQVHIDITLPRHELIVNRAPSEHHAHEDVYVAIRDAFKAAGRQLEDYVLKQRDELKSHESAMQSDVLDII